MGCVKVSKVGERRTGGAEQLAVALVTPHISVLLFGIVPGTPCIRGKTRVPRPRIFLT